RVDAAGEGKADQLRPEPSRAHHQVGRKGAVAEDQPAVVEVLQEVIERLDPLRQAALDPLPGPSADDPRDEVEGKDLLDPLVVLVDGEGDAVVAEAALGA